MKIFFLLKKQVKVENPSRKQNLNIQQGEIFGSEKDNLIRNCNKLTKMERYKSLQKPLVAGNLRKSIKDGKLSIQ